MRLRSLESLPDDSYVSIGHVARYLGVSVTAVRQYGVRGELVPDAQTPGRHRRYRVSVVKDFRRSWSFSSDPSRRDPARPSPQG